MRPLQRDFVLSIVLVSPSVFSQSVKPPRVLPPAQATTQVTRQTPNHIRVGCKVQSAYIGPAQLWFNNGTRSLSDAQIADLERLLSASPQDICARGYLIAHGQDRVSRRMDHVLWMIENHPDWDGFMLNLSSPGYRVERDTYQRIRAAWLKQVGPDQQNGTVLHNAAAFFERNEPDFAVALLERAIRLEPAVPFHVEGLGAVYGHSQFGTRAPSFAARAKSTLLSSTDWLIVAGALNAVSAYGKGINDFGKLLLARLADLTGSRNPIDLLKALPSQSAQYCHSQCNPVPLLRRCDDTLIR